MFNENIIQISSLDYTVVSQNNKEKLWMERKVLLSWKQENKKYFVTSSSSKVIEIISVY